MKTPTAEWTLDELAQYAKDALVAWPRAKAKYDRALTAFGAAKEDRARNVWRAGGALKIARDKLLPLEQWFSWQVQHSLKPTSVLEAIKLREAYATEDDLKDYTLTEAKVKKDIIAAKPPVGPLGPTLVSATAPKPFRRADRMIRGLEPVMIAVKEAAADGHGDDLGRLAAELRRLADMVDAEAAMRKPARRKKVAV